MNTWPDGHRRALHQDEHERWNENHCPGTRQVCAMCGEFTERCEEDAMWGKDGEPLCESCYLRSLADGNM